MDDPRSHSGPAPDGTRASGAACVKVILLGEHAVVFGEPAIAVGLPDGVAASARWAPANSRLAFEDGAEPAPLQGALAQLLVALGLQRAVEVQVRSTLPSGVGLGVSAAIGVAAARACVALAGADPGPAQMEQALFAWESVFHGTPSGIDHTAAARGGIFLFQRSAEPEGAAQVTPLRCGAPLQLVVAVVSPSPPTRTMVEHVRDRVAASAAARDAIAAIGALVRDAAPRLEAGDTPALGELMNRNHALLRSLGVSTPRLDAACAAALAAGALGAKITGGGGGGCIVALAGANHTKVREALRACSMSVLHRSIR